MPLYQQAAEAILAADALLIGAGAGTGVDSGLPDYRGPQGFLRAYPAFRGRRFEEISNPVWFRTDPEQAWGFFGHRLNLYRTTVPHMGFEILRRWGESRQRGYFVFTSNVDGHFQRAGFDSGRILECHGSPFSTPGARQIEKGGRFQHPGIQQCGWKRPDWILHRAGCRESETATSLSDEVPAPPSNCGSSAKASRCGRSGLLRPTFERRG